MARRGDWQRGPSGAGSAAAGCPRASRQDAGATEALQSTQNWGPAGIYYLLNLCLCIFYHLNSTWRV